jgi:hypothetical protein
MPFGDFLCGNTGGDKKDQRNPMELEWLSVPSRSICARKEGSFLFSVEVVLVSPVLWLTDGGVPSWGFGRWIGESRFLMA